MHDWTCSPIIARVLNLRATGREDRNWLQWVKARLPGGKVGLALSVGCGSGMLERDAIAQGLCDAMEGVDIAPGAIEVAASEAGGLPVTYRVMDLQVDELEAGRYDAVFCASALHHIKDLGHCLQQMSGSLKEGGVLVLSEYVGPDRFQWEPGQLRRVMDVYAFLPAAWRHNVLAAGTVFYPRRPGLPEMIEGDPSEAVRSSEMLELVEWYFERVDRLDIGGTLLNPLLNGIAGNFGEDDALDTSFLRLAALLEDLWIGSGVLASDFILDVYVKRPVPLVPAGGLEDDALLCSRITGQEQEILRLQEERKALGAKNDGLERRCHEARLALEAAGPREKSLQAEIAALRDGAAPRHDRSARVSGPAEPDDEIAPTFEHAMRLFASADSRAITRESEGAPVWRRWVAEVTGCDPGDIELEAGDANVLGRGNSYEVVAVPKGAGDGGAGFEARLEACLPEGWSLASQSNAPTRLTNNLPEGALVARRSFLAGGVERPEGGGEMAQCVEDMACYVACEAACLGLLGPALEVSIYGAAGQSPGPETGRQDTVTMQEAEIARLEVLLAGGEEACGRLEGEGERFEAELSRARASLDALQRERDIMSRPWPLRKAGMWLEARRRAKLGL